MGSSDIISETKVADFAADLELALDAVEGDPVAAATIEREYRPTLIRVLIARGVEVSAAEDLVADVIAECFGAGKNGQICKPLLKKFGGRSSLSTWLIRTTWNRWLDLKRRDKFRGELPIKREENDQGDHFDRIEGDDPGDDLLESDLAELMGDAIQAAFDSIEPESLLMLKLNFLHGVSQTTIAQMWNCDQTRVSRSLASARDAIAVETMRILRDHGAAADITWRDFRRLCAAGVEW